MRNKITALILSLALTACGAGDDHTDAQQAPAEEATGDQSLDTPTLETERQVRTVRVDIEQRPYYTTYDLGISAVVATPEFETHGWKLAYAIKEGSEPETCNDGEFTGADYPPLTVWGVKPETHYFIIACPIHNVRGEYGKPLVKEFTTGSLRK